MIFDEKSRKLPQTGSSLISSTANDRPVEPKLNGLFLITFEEKSRNFRRPEVTVSRQQWARESSNQNQNVLLLVIFLEKSQNLSQTESDRISSTMNDRPVEPKLKWPIFDDFRRKIPKNTRDRKWPCLVNGKRSTHRKKSKMAYFWWFSKESPEK